MLVVHSPASPLHDPTGYFRRGQVVPHPEQASRYGVLREAAAGAGHTLVEAGDAGLGPLLVVHTPGYLDLLATAWGRRGEVPDAGEELLTTHFARPHMTQRPVGLFGLLGYHMADTSTPIRAGTWQAVYASAQAAVAAADAVERHGVAYALCRPPGHHAYADSAGGFCFLNNTAVAAARLRAAGASRVAIVDVDVHHGNGTQGIFYGRSDVLTVSVHADPSDYFPFFAGYAEEVGIGEGRGFNLNCTVAPGAGDADWLSALSCGLAAAERFRPDALVVALGLDASEDDPVGALAVSERGFREAGHRIAGLRVPTALVQEGGYLCEALPRNLVAFLSAFEEVHRGS